MQAKAMIEGKLSLNSFLVILIVKKPTREQVPYHVDVNFRSVVSVSKNFKIMLG